MFKHILVKSLISHLQSSICSIQDFPSIIHITHDFTFPYSKGQYLDIDTTTLSLSIVNQQHTPRNINRQTAVLLNELTDYAKTLRDKHNCLLLAPTSLFHNIDITTIIY